ncbi:MAG: FadR family transcriptional regulator [Candidatus Protistobacter heckmanni]|nr:FadR family transcriptional regulator [Candidatus Protistobacter heckmanni]
MSRSTEPKPEPKAAAASAAAAAAPGQGAPRKAAEAGGRVRLSDQLYGEIFDRIMSGELKVGDQLPSENEIAEGFGVSRPVVREALLRLRTDGLIVAHQGLGSFVSQQPVSRIKAFASPQDLSSYLRCHEVRLALEGDAARLAAERRTDAQMAAIETAHRQFLDNVQAGRINAQDDLDFHRAIAEATGNSFYVEVLENIHVSLLGFMRLSLNLTRTGPRQRSQRVLDEHVAIVEAIRNRRGEEARIAMQHHLSQAKNRMLDRERDK